MLGGGIELTQDLVIVVCVFSAHHHERIIFRDISFGDTVQQQQQYIYT